MDRNCQPDRSRTNPNTLEAMLCLRWISSGLVLVVSKGLLAGTLISLIATTGVAVGQVANVYSVNGRVELRSGSGKWQPLGVGASCDAGDEIRTGSGARAGIRFAGGKLVRLRENSRLKIDVPNSGGQQRGRMTLSAGVLYLFSRKSQEFPQIDTPEVSAAIRGTEVVVATSAGQTKVTVIEGAVAIKSPQGVIELGPGEEGRANAGQVPYRALQVNSLEAVQWALHYPGMVGLTEFAPAFTHAPKKVQQSYQQLLAGSPSSALRVLDGESGPQASLGRALVHHELGNNITALDELARIPAGRLMADELLRGVILLAIGRVPEADKALLRVRERMGGLGWVAGCAAAQQAIIAVVHNRGQEAQRLIELATTAAPQSTSVALARAYVHQSERELEEASEWVAKAAKFDPRNAFVLARQAELELAQGRYERALEFASAAVRQEPDNAFAQTVLGYARLIQARPSDALASFQQAVKLDSTSGLPRLGRALALIQLGDLESGRQEIEQAVHLEPMVSQYRSYLGKAFFEEESEELAQSEYERAIELDPQDPTPYLYRAFNWLSWNQPVRALADIEDSIARNNNRAVYRSSFLLDQDLAVRGTSLAEAFSQLGFSRVAQLEAIKSVNRDYGNYSAHRLLADSHTGDFMADARFNEHVIADLLAPLSYNVFQGLKGYSSQAGLNEYSALFDRPEHRTSISGLAESYNDRLKGAVFQSGKLDNWGYLAGYRSDYGRGRKRYSDYEREQRLDLAGQYQLSPQDQVILQGGYTRTEDLWTETGAKLDDYEIALGSRHELDYNSQILTRIEYFDRTFDSYELNEIRSAEGSLIVNGSERPWDIGELYLDNFASERFKTLRASAQHIYQSNIVDVITGVEWLAGRNHGDEEATIIDDTVALHNGSSLSSQGDYRGRSWRGYWYSNWHASSWADLNLGLSYASLELPRYDLLPPFLDGERSTRAWSPKIGISVELAPETLLRGAYFRGIGNSTISDIGSIEPTLVGGFSQIYGDLPGAESETWAIGIDHKIPKRFYMGCEYLYRSIDREAANVTNVLTVDLDQMLEVQSFRYDLLNEREQEHVWRSYFYQVMTDRLTATVDYQYSELEGLNFSDDNQSDRVALGINYFDPARWFAFARGTWRHQERSGFDAADQWRAAFWLLDVGAGYRLPQRHGVVQVVLRNLLDQDFVYDDRGREPVLYQDFNAALEVAFNF